MFRSFATMIALTLATANTALAETAVSETTGGAFASRDADKNGRISAAEATEFASLAFASMDSDADAQITPAEFQAWSLGFEYLAWTNGRERQLVETKEVIFQLADADGDERISPLELTAHVSRDFAYADINADGHLTPFEASSRSPWVVALLRAAQP